MPSVPIWVAVLYCSDRTFEKITNDHGLDFLEVRRAVVCQKALQVRRHTDNRGHRFIVTVGIGGRPMILVLFPDPDDVDVYHLATAYPDR